MKRLKLAFAALIGLTAAPGGAQGPVSITPVSRPAAIILWGPISDGLIGFGLNF